MAFSFSKIQGGKSIATLTTAPTKATNKNTKSGDA